MTISPDPPRAAPEAAPRPEGSPTHRPRNGPLACGRPLPVPGARGEPGVTCTSTLSSPERPAVRRVRGGWLSRPTRGRWQRVQGALGRGCQPCPVSGWNPFRQAAGTGPRAGQPRARVPNAHLRIRSPWRPNAQVRIRSGGGGGAAECAGAHSGPRVRGGDTPSGTHPTAQSTAPTLDERRTRCAVAARSTPHHDGLRGPHPGITIPRSQPP